MRLASTRFAPIALLGLAASVMVACSHPVMAADSSACYNIADPDARTYCLAKARSEPAMCYAIYRQDLRSMCLAEVRP